MENTNFDGLREDAFNAIVECLEDGYTGYYSDMHHAIFNTDYYIIGTYEAKRTLESIGVFDVIEKVQDYEQTNFGELITELSDPEKLINMIYYIIGEEVLYHIMNSVTELDRAWNRISDEETNNDILDNIRGINI